MATIIDFLGTCNYESLLKALDNYNASVRRFLNPEEYPNADNLDKEERAHIEKLRIVREIQVLRYILDLESILPNFSSTTEYCSKDSVVDTLDELIGNLARIDPEHPFVVNRRNTPGA